jgi:hypothetical protein
MSAKADETKLMDVVPPGASPPSTTSRPIIVGHAASVKKDPMVNAASSDPEEKDPPAANIQTHGITKLQPVTDIIPADAEESSPEPDAEPSNVGLVDVLVNEVGTKKADQKQQEELEKQNAELEKSIESKEFFVPIGLVSRRRSHLYWIIFGLFLLLLLVGVNFGIDAELIEIGVEPLTNLL